MEIENKIISAVAAGIKQLYGQDVPESAIQLQTTKKEFEGHLTLVVFPFLKISKKKPEDTAQEIGNYLKTFHSQTGKIRIYSSHRAVSARYDRIFFTKHQQAFAFRPCA